MCTEEQKAQELTLLQQIAKLLDSRTPIDRTIQISDNAPWTMDYMGFKHVFLWLPAAYTLSIGEYGSGPVQAQVWVNLGLRPGTQLKTSGQSTLVPVILRFTDEEVP